MQHVIYCKKQLYSLIYEWKINYLNNRSSQRPNFVNSCSSFSEIKKENQEDGIRSSQSQGKEKLHNLYYGNYWIVNYRC